eukprot:53798_1
MLTIDSVFKPFPQLPLKCEFYQAKPSFYHSNLLIISTDYGETNPGIFEYNLDNNNLEMLQKYEDIEPEDYGQFIDYESDTLHIISTRHNLHAIMDLKTKIINKQEFYGNEYAKAIHISAKKHEIHVVSDDMVHLEFDCEGQDFIRLNSKNDKLKDELMCIKLLYIETNEQIMILGADVDDNIYYYDIEEANQWKLMNNIKMPHIVDSRDYDVLSFYDVIMV